MRKVYFTEGKTGGQAFVSESICSFFVGELRQLTEKVNSLKKENRELRLRLERQKKALFHLKRKNRKEKSR